MEGAAVEVEEAEEKAQATEEDGRIEGAKRSLLTGMVARGAIPAVKEAEGKEMTMRTETRKMMKMVGVVVVMARTVAVRVMVMIVVVAGHPHT